MLPNERPTQETSKLCVKRLCTNILPGRGLFYSVVLCFLNSTKYQAFALREIEAVRLESGAPAYRFSGATARWVADHGLTAHLSLSHDGGMALAFCILETAPET